MRKLLLTVGLLEFLVCSVQGADLPTKAPPEVSRVIGPVCKRFQKLRHHIGSKDSNA
jgi:hypothetical protein